MNKMKSSIGRGCGPTPQRSTSAMRHSGNDKAYVTELANSGKSAESIRISCPSSSAEGRDCSPVARSSADSGKDQLSLHSEATTNCTGSCKTCVLDTWTSITKLNTVAKLSVT